MSLNVQVHDPQEYDVITWDSAKGVFINEQPDVLLGVSGANLLMGPTGPTGLSDVAGPTGYTGPAGPTGVTGAKGPTGYTGPAGAGGSIWVDFSSSEWGWTGESGNITVVTVVSANYSVKSPYVEFECVVNVELSSIAPFSVTLPVPYPVGPTTTTIFANAIAYSSGTGVIYNGFGTIGDGNIILYAPVYPSDADSEPQFYVSGKYIY